MQFLLGTAGTNMSYLNAPVFLGLKLIWCSTGLLSNIWAPCALQTTSASLSRIFN